MNTNRVAACFITVLVMACCLVFWGFTSPASAKPIVVTTLTDTADPPFNADSLCGTGTVGDLPGADGFISLREAIIAANNTPGAHTITFDPSLSGGTIWSTLMILIPILTLIRCLRSAGGTPASRATSMAMASRTSRWRGRLSPLCLGSLASPSFMNNVVDVRLEQNTVKNHTRFGINILAGVGSFDGQAGAIADHNHISAIMRQNVVEDSTVRGVQLAAGDPGLASANTLDVRVEQNTVCSNGTDIVGEGGFSGSVFLPVPNMGTGNVLEGRIFQNTATTVTVADGTPGNTATVTQLNNVPCP